MDESAHEKVCDAMQILTEVGWQLQHLASAFARIGNNHVAKELQQITVDIAQANELVRKATGEAIALTARRSEEATANMFTAVLAVATIATCKEAKEAI